MKSKAAMVQVGRRLDKRWLAMEVRQREAR